jgi:hypothetical protein
MSIEIEVLSESYSILKQYLPQKDRQEAADVLVSVLIDFLCDEDLRDFVSTDSTLTKAWNQYESDDQSDDTGNDY